MKCTFYDKSPREKVITIWGEDRCMITEVSNVKRNGRWVWECRHCKTSAPTPWKACEHIAEAWRFVQLRKAEEEARAADDAPIVPRRRFAPCPD